MYECDVVPILSLSKPTPEPTQSLWVPLPHCSFRRCSARCIRAVTPSSAPRQRRSISRVKCFASWGDSMISSVSSLVWAADGLQLKLPVITVLLSITANLWCSLSPRARRVVLMPSACSGFEGSTQACSGLSWLYKPEPKPEGHL